MNKQHIILTDFETPANWAFLDSLKETTGKEWTERPCVTNRLHGSKLKNLWRFVIYFFFPLKVLLGKKRYDNIIAWQQFYGLNFAFWSRFLHARKTCNLLIMTYIYNYRGGVIGRFKFRYMRYIVTSKYVDKFVCFSKNECAYYAKLFGVSEDKFLYVPLGIDASENKKVVKGDYLFTTGRSNRDYEFLVDAIKGKGEKLVIACDSYYGKEGEGVEVDRDCYGEKMRDRMAKSLCVVIPLKDPKVSAGQLVILQAMEMGKPVIATASEGIADYIDNGQTGLIVKKTPEAIIEAVDKLKHNRDLYQRLSTQSQQQFKERHTINAMGKAIGAALRGA